MDLHLKDKVVLITGGAKGIGAAIVRAVAAESAIPVIVDRDAEAGRRLQGELPAQRTNCRRTLPSGRIAKLRFWRPSRSLDGSMRW